LVRERLAISNGKNQLLLFDIGNLASVKLEATQYLSRDEALKYITAGAIYSSNPISKFADRLFIDINRPKPPAQLFSKREVVKEKTQLNG
jgi:hypothetical protein